MNPSDETKVSSLSVPKKLPPLLTSSLGDQEVVKRAEAAVKHLCEVVPNPNLNVSIDVRVLDFRDSHFSRHCFNFIFFEGRRIVSIAYKTSDYESCSRIG